MVYTKDYLANVAVELARQKSLDQITVKDLVDRCGTTRQTFYYYFDDLPDLLRYALRRETGEMMQRAARDPDPDEALRSFVEFVDRNGVLLSNVFNTRYRDDMDRILLEFVRVFLENLLRGQALEELPAEEREFALEYHAYAVKDVLLHWRRERHEDTEATVRRIHSLLEREFRAQ